MVWMHIISSVPPGNAADRRGAGNCSLQSVSGGGKDPGILSRARLVCVESLYICFASSPRDVPTQCLVGAGFLSPPLLGGSIVTN